MLDFPASPNEFREAYPHYYDRAFKEGPPIECPLNATHTMMYLQSIAQRQSKGISPTKLFKMSPVDTGHAVVPWQRQGSACSSSSNSWNSASTKAQPATPRLSMADTETPHFTTDGEREYVLK